jgi:hypothetical protein
MAKYAYRIIQDPMQWGKWQVQIRKDADSPWGDLGDPSPSYAAALEKKINHEKESA